MTRRLGPLLALALALLLPCLAARAGVIDYPITPDSADIRFHTVVAGTVPVDGAFTHFSGHILVDPDHPEAVRINVTVADDAMVVPFGAAPTLRGRAYFDHEQFPEMRFESAGAALGQGGQFTIAGRLTLRGVTQPQNLTGSITRAMRHGVPVLLVLARGTLDRTGYGMVADRPLIADRVALQITATLRLP